MHHNEATPTFSKLRSFLWPIHAHEHKKLLPMFILFFMISFVYNVLRCMKVTLVVTAEGSGTEVIPFLKVWGVLPAAVLLTLLYTKLSNYLNREQVFYSIVSLFLGFFAVFMFFLYPNREALEITSMSELVDHLPASLEGLWGFLMAIRHWHLSLFYILSELWSAIVLSMLFWGFANEVTTVDEAKRFYAIFALGANSSGIFSGQCARFLTLDQTQAWLPFGKDAWEQSLFLQISVILAMGIIIMLLFRWSTQTLLKGSLSNTTRTLNREQTIQKEDESSKLSLLECLKQLIKSPYMLYITILVVAYNITYNLSDFVWTEQVRQRYPDAGEFNSYINNIASLTGVFATISALLLSGNVIRRYGWTTTAMITPIIWLVTSVGFFGCLLCSDTSMFSDIMVAFFNAPILSLALMFGSAQICLGRAAKYTVFDESKEIAFIPLPKEAQRKGKAVVDGIASRFGKSGGAIMIQVLLAVCGELIFTIPYIAGIFVVALTLWIFAVRRLGNMVSHTIDLELQSKDSISDSIPLAKETSVA